MLLMRVATLTVVMLAAALGWADPAKAADQITGGCTVSPSAITFAQYTLANSTVRDADGTINVTCTGTGNNTVTISLSPGGGTCSARRMAAGAALISYNLFTTSGYSTVWCEPTRVSVAFTFNSATIPQTQTKPVTVYGRVPAGQTVTVGSYTDSISTTVFWTGGNSSPTSFNVTISVVPNCTLSITHIAFDKFTGTAKDGQGTLDVTCTSGLAYTIALGGGGNAASGTRRMKSPANHFLPYLLYRESARTSLWGDGVSMGSTVAATGTGSVLKHGVFGRVSSVAAPTPGTYSDTVVVTLSY